MQPRLLRGSSPAEAVANATAGQEPGLPSGCELKPVLLRVNFINGVGEPALKSSNLAEKWGVKGEFVTRVVGCANGAKRRDKNVEGGKMVK